MRWQLLQSIDEIVLGERIAGRARTDFPEELFADHFPSFPVTPGVLLVELAAQLAGRLVQATWRAEHGEWVFPVLSIIRESKFRSFVPPRVTLAVTAELENLGPDGALLRARLKRDQKRCATMRLLLAFDPAGGVGGGDAETLAEHTCREFARLGSPWQPS